MSRNRGNVLFSEKIRGILNSESMTKKGHQNFWRLKTENLFWEKVKLEKISWSLKNRRK